MSEKKRVIKVDYLARVEGEGTLYIKISGDKVVDVKLKIFEPPRFFEAFLRGRMYSEAPDITARICGICPVAYQMSSVQAMEQIFGVRVNGAIRDLRRLLYCGEWIESHSLHVYMLHAPDFLGYADVIQMGQKYPELVRDALRLKKIGNRIMQIVGGREIHPINVRVGGFYRVPDKAELAPLTDELKWARDAAVEMVRWTSKLEFPSFEQDYEFVSLRHESEYPIIDGRLVSSSGMDIEVKDYEKWFTEEHVPHSHALHSVMKGKGNYFVGPLARYSLNFDRLPGWIQEEARATGLGPVCKNPFQSIVVRSIETLYACDEALRIISNYEAPESPYVEFNVTAGIGTGCTEAPRGILYHRYQIDEAGKILQAKIVPPTSQNQKTIENDLREFVPGRTGLSNEQLTWQCEQAIRNYDPCISCATHFLKLEVERS